MSGLRPEYQAILNKASSLVIGWPRDTTVQIRYAVEQCQTLADRPPKMLTNEEINNAKKSESMDRHWFARAIIAAHIAKQSAPEVVPFNFQEWNKGGWVALNADGIKQYHLYANTTYTSMERES